MYRERARCSIGPASAAISSAASACRTITDPYQIYEEMRAQGPMLPTRLGNYTTTSHRLCNEVLRSRSFGVDPRTAARTLPTRQDSTCHCSNSTHPITPGSAGSPHRPSPHGGWQATWRLVDQAIQELLDQCEREREFDLMTSFASPLPIAVVTHLLGLPNDPERLRRLGSTIARALDGIWSLGQARTLAAADAELRTTFATLLDGAERTQAMTWCLLWWLSKAKITAAELSALVRLLLIAGFETTVNAIGNGMHWLLADREQWDCSSKTPGGTGCRRGGAPIRSSGPADGAGGQSADRGGQCVGRKNQWVITLLAAANRDPDVYPEPNRFDISRESPVEHLAFSGGIHYCLGSPLASLELTQAFRALAERFPRIRQTAPITMRPGTTLRGPPRSRWRCPSASWSMRCASARMIIVG